MDTTALTAAVEANSQVTTQVRDLLEPLRVAVTAEIADVQALLVLLANGPAEDPAAEQAIADAVAKADASTADLVIVRDALASLTSQTTADDGSVPTTPTP